MFAKKVFIVAEIGNNHEGDLSLAKKLIKLASKAKVDAVKFQYINPYKLFGGPKSKKIIKKYKKYSFSHNQYELLANYAKKKKLIFFTSIFDLENFKKKTSIQKIIKISSGDNNFFQLIEKSISANKKIIISLGMTSDKMLLELKNKLEYFKKKYQYKEKISLLHCTSSYPVNIDNVNLGQISYLKKIFPNYIIGYSDHSIGIEIPSLSVIAGAQIVEKHFTISHKLSKFRDHHLSANFNELCKLVENIRRNERIFGNFKSRKILDVEKENAKLARRSLYTNQNMEIGDKFSKENITYLRPAIGLRPNDDIFFFKKKIKKKIKKNIIIKKSLVL